MGQQASGLNERYFMQKVRLGHGSFGTVWRAVDRRSGKEVAVKQMDKRDMRRNGLRQEDVEREVAMMRACTHDNIIQLYDSFEDSDSIYLAQEYCAGGDFGDKLRERGLGVREHEAADWIRQMCSAIAALHSKQICHRDIKPDNFLVASGSEVAGGGSRAIKLADFGLAVFLPRGKLLTQKCGTPAFMAPEQHLIPRRSRGYSFPVDVWAAGVSMYQVMCGSRHPFLDKNGRLSEQVLLKGALDFRPGAPAEAGQRFSEDAEQLCSRMVDIDPTRRIAAREILRSPWLNAGSRDALAGAAAAERPPDQRDQPSQSRSSRALQQAPRRWTAVAGAVVDVPPARGPLVHAPHDERSGALRGAGGVHHVAPLYARCVGAGHDRHHGGAS